MVSKWKKLKMLLGLRVCAIAVPEPPDFGAADRSIEVLTSDPDPLPTSTLNPYAQSAPATPTRSASATVHSGGHGLRVSRSTCSICLETMKLGHGHALFTAECSHTFHFSCIASNVRYGNLVCPVCRAKWREVPWQAPVDGPKGEKGRGGSQTRRAPTVPRSLSQAGRAFQAVEEQSGHGPSIHILDESIYQAQWQHSHPTEPTTYNDDEPLMQPCRETSNLQESGSEHGPSNTTVVSGAGDVKMEARADSKRTKLDVKLYSEVSAVPALESQDSFTVLVHLKAPAARKISIEERRLEEVTNSTHFLDPSYRAPLDLVTVLDISGSMAGTKMALLKRAMGFVIRNLSPADRLSVVVFSSTARRIFALRRMVPDGQQQSLQAINALVANGGTNISEGLKTGAKVLEDRRERNPVSSIMLLSDGQDTFNMSSGRSFPFFLNGGFPDSRRLIPSSIRHSERNGHIQIPVHTFGFGADHDATTMHTISEVSGGTFSFIQTEGMVQDAFAQCIGGLLSVVMQDVQLMISCSASGVLIDSIHAGSYDSSILDSARHAIIKLGDLYAEEERDFLVDVKLPSLSEAPPDGSMPLLRAFCMYTDPVTLEMNQNVGDELFISRPAIVDEGQQVFSLEVDRQRNRLRTAEAIAEARSLADQGNISAAQCSLQNAKAALGSSPSALAGDQLCSVLDAELIEIQGRMANRQLYERSGRAYLLSAHSSHLRQRATTRRESLDSNSQDYQTPSMVDMILRSQILSLPEVPSPGAFASGATLPNGDNNVNVSNSFSRRSLLRRPSARVQSYHGNG